MVPSLVEWKHKNRIRIAKRTMIRVTWASPCRLITIERNRYLWNNGNSSVHSCLHMCQKQNVFLLQLSEKNSIDKTQTNCKFNLPWSTPTTRTILTEGENSWKMHWRAWKRKLAVECGEKSLMAVISSTTKSLNECMMFTTNFTDLIAWRCTELHASQN